MRSLVVIERSPWPMLVGVGLLGLPLTALMLIIEPWVLQITPTMLAAVCFYLCGHGLRILRTIFVLGGHSRSVRQLAVAHLVTTPWGLLPFKLGELARIGALGQVSGSAGLGLATVWIERTFDAAVLLIIALCVVVTQPTVGLAVLPIATLSAILLLLTAIAAYALPENLAMAKLWIIQRPSQPWSVPVLEIFDRVGDALRLLETMLRHKVSTLAGLTFAIWAAELFGIGALVQHIASIGDVVSLFATVTDVVRPVDQLGAQMLQWRHLVSASFVAMSLFGILMSLIAWRRARA